jgi:predicted ATPase/transcriptional regulator with GAF, ATPase, and Fis domain
VIPGYRALEEIGGDGLHRLHRGVQTSDGALVLLKIPVAPSPVSISLLQREHDILSALRIEGVPAARAFHVESGTLVFDDGGGHPLHLLLSAGRMEFGLFIEAARGLASTLAELHRRRVIHRNLSPYSILIDARTGRTDLIDFSIASRLPQDSQAPHPPRLLQGRLAYISPEQTGRMNRHVDYRSDLYSLGITFYQMLTGRLPFEGDDPLEIVHGHIAKMPPPPSEIEPSIPRPVSEIVMRLLAKAAEDRYQSAAGLRVDLEACAAQWARSGHVAPFRLGERDLSDRFTIPQHLYGREGEVRDLLEAFERAASGPSTLMLVSGYSGIGKTSLVREVHKPIVKRRGRFTSGKFDQLERSQPYGAVLQAFRALLNQILAESEDQIASFRTRLREALDASAGVVAAVIPELEILLGPQPPVPELGPAESQNRFNYAFQSFLGAMASPDQPLVVFLDDLQWADPATLKLLALLLTTPSVRNLFLIGAYRENEVGPGHPLARLLAEMRGAGAAVHEIVLPPLEISHLTDLILDALRCDPAQAAALARLVLSKTGGNPFFLTQFLKLLHEEGLIWFDHGAGRWAFDLERIERAPMTDNVIDLMAGKLKKLAPPTRQAIALAACVGNFFTLSTLALVRQRTLAQSARDLWEAIEEGLILPSSDRYELYAEAPESVLEMSAPAYTFLHDRVQQAAYSLIPEDQRDSLHLTVGRLLLAGGGEPPPEDRVFEIVNHLNIARGLITEEEERTKLVRLNLRAGRKARDSAAFSAALDYFERGLALLPAGPWASHYDLSLELTMQVAECAYLCGLFEESERLFEILLREARSPLEKAEAYRIRIIQFDSLTRYGDAVRGGREGLALLRVKLPEDEGEKVRALEGEMERIQAFLGDRTIASLEELPVMQDAETRMIVALCSAMWASAYILGDGTLASLLSAQIVSLSLERGNTEDSAYGYVTHAVAVGPVRQDYRSAYAWGLLALRVNERFGDHKGRARVQQQFNAHVNLWRRPIETCMPHAREACRSGLESGDFAYAGYGAFTETWAALLSCRDLDLFIRDFTPTVALLERIRRHSLASAQRLFIQWARALQGRTSSPLSLSDGTFDERDYASTYAANGFCMTFLYAARVQLGVMFEEHGPAARAARTARSEAWTPRGTIWPVFLDFWEGLAIAALDAETPEEERSSRRAELKSARESLEVLAESCPENFRCWWLLLDAEMNRIEGHTAESVELFEEAISYARRSGSLQNEALANDLCARLWLEGGRAAVAAVHMSEAHRCYAAWGAAAKVSDLESRYGRLLKNRPASVAAVGPSVEPGAAPREPASLDLSTVLKAARAIVVEIELDELLRKLMRIALENVGAERGVFLENREERLVVAAEATAAPEKVVVGPSIPLEQATNLSHGVVRYVFRSRQGVVIDDASTDERFAGDPYLLRSGCRSILCVPVVHQGRVGGVLYLENNLAIGAFTPNRIEMMQILSAEAAIALENARLYAATKDEIERRRAAELALREAVTELEGLKNRLEAENVYLQEEIRAQHNFEEIVGNSPALLDALHLVERVSATESTVLIIGETGSGKELFARAIHSLSSRRDRTLVKVNCGAIPAGLVESELFGHAKGAFTGALQRRIGRFELADGGTIFLDEVGELPLETQVKLLRVLQELEFEPVGSSRTIRVNVRVIAATNRNLAAAVREGKFRQDLLYRLNVFPLHVPPLRDRRQDIPLLAGFFVGALSKKLGKRLEGFSRRSMDRLMIYSWPGNVREMQNVIERAAVLAQGPILEIESELAREGATPSGARPPEPEESKTLAEREREHILEVLRKTGGVVQGPGGAATILGLNPNTLRSRMKKLGIR